MIGELFESTGMMRRVPPRVFRGEDDRKGSSCYSRLAIIICLGREQLDTARGRRMQIK